MAKNSESRGPARSSNGPMVLTQADADKFKTDAKKYAAAATATKKKAQTKLVALGIHTPTGRLTKRYG